MLLLLLILYPPVILSVCPGLDEGTPSAGSDSNIPDITDYEDALQSLDISAVFEDIGDLLTESQDCWPADTLGGATSYGGLFVRLSWHCSGSYRDGDGLGGCSGGRQRFSPEASWDDNTNLDKARALLAPIKEAYGDALSWGDLMIFAGSAAIYHMGGPIQSICAGRIDDEDGTLSNLLGPTTESGTCTDPALCEEPFGTTQIGLIYVNPEGVGGVPDPLASAIHIREIFGRMDMNDSETVALIGGGHAFGKSHGACPDGAGSPPSDAPDNPWPGLCGTNFPLDTFTSGLEGQWTTYPFVWDNEFFTQLIDDDYNLTVGDGDKYQWVNNRNEYMMLTTDLALINDDDYLSISTDFANNLENLEIAFSAAWKKLTESGGTWAENKFCIDPSDLLIPSSTEATDAVNKYDVVVSTFITLLCFAL